MGGGLETTLAEITRKLEMAVDDCAELANLKLQLAQEVKQRTHFAGLYILIFEMSKADHQKQHVSLVEPDKINAGLELQRASNAEIDKQRQDMCDSQLALLRKLEAELHQAQRDLDIKENLLFDCFFRPSSCSLTSRRKRSVRPRKIQLRDASKEIKHQNTLLKFVSKHDPSSKKLSLRQIMRI